jgi:hypothetical protein
MSTKSSNFFEVGAFSDRVLVVIGVLLVMDALLEDRGWSRALARAHGGRACRRILHGMFADGRAACSILPFTCVYNLHEQGLKLLGITV